MNTGLLKFVLIFLFTSINVVGFAEEYNWNTLRENKEQEYPLKRPDKRIIANNVNISKNSLLSLYLSYNDIDIRNKLITYIIENQDKECLSYLLLIDSNSINNESNIDSNKTIDTNNNILKLLTLFCDIDKNNAFPFLLSACYASKINNKENVRKFLDVALTRPVYHSYLKEIYRQNIKTNLENANDRIVSFTPPPSIYLVYNVFLREAAPIIDTFLTENKSNIDVDKVIIDFTEKLYEDAPFLGNILVFSAIAIHFKSISDTSRKVLVDKKEECLMLIKKSLELKGDEKSLLLFLQDAADSGEYKAVKKICP